MKRDPVEVLWLDSVGGSGWEHPDAARRDASTETMRCHTIGYLLEDTDDYLLLCMGQMENSGSVLAPLQIPKVAVIRVTEVIPVKEGPYIRGGTA
jgi:hypothetical protein